MSTPTIDYDALAQQHGGAATVDYDALAAQHGAVAAPSKWSLGSVLSGTDPAHQAFDKLTQTIPVDTSSVGGFAKSVGTDLGAGTARLLSPVAHPIDAALGTAQAMRAGMGDTGAQNDLASGMVRPFVQNPSGEAVAAIPQVAAAALGTGKGPAAARAVEDATPAGGVADAAVNLAQKTGSKFLPSLIDGPPQSLLTRAIKPGKNNVSWNSDLQTAMPLMKSAEQTIGKPIGGVDDALEAAQAAKKQIWQQYQQRLGPAVQQGMTIDGNKIADAMMASIDKRTAVQNPGLVQRVQQIADTYRKPLNLSDAEDFLQSANKDLNTYYSKNKVGQQVAQNDPDTASTVAEAGALRDALYNKLDQVSGPGAAQLKQAYGSLTNVQKELYGRQLVAARQNPESLSEQLGTISGAGRIAKGVFTMNPGDVLEGAQNIVVSRALKARNSSDSMIERAFKAAQPAAPFPMPTWRPPQTTNLLPASGETGNRYPMMAPDPGMSGGENIAALMQYLRQKPQLALPAKANPIQLPPPQ